MLRTEKRRRNACDDQSLPTTSPLPQPMSKRDKICKEESSTPTKNSTPNRPMHTPKEPIASFQTPQNQIRRRTSIPSGRAEVPTTQARLASPSPASPSPCPASDGVFSALDQRDASAASGGFGDRQNTREWVEHTANFFRDLDKRPLKVLENGTS